MFNFDSIFYWKEHNRGVIQTTNIQLQYIINIPVLEINIKTESLRTIYSRVVAYI
jgi:hypothetical protein